MMKNILVISLNRLGDNLQVTPVLEVLKEKYPKAHIALLTEKGYEIIFENNPNINQTYLFHRDRYTSEGLLSFKNFRFDSELQGLLLKEFDLIINRQSSNEAAMFAGIIKAKEKKGLIALENGGFFIADPWTRLLFAMVKNRKQNPFGLIEYNVRIAGGIPGTSVPKVYFGSKTDFSFPKEFALTSQDKIVAIQAGSSSSARNWGAENFGRLARLLLKESSQIKIALTGSSAEKEILKKMILAVPESDRNRIYDSSHISIYDLPSLLSQCHLMISNDTGPMHMAAALGCKILGLYFGGSLIQETAPFGKGNIILQADLDCLPCVDDKKCEYLCKSSIKVEAVKELALFQLGIKDEINKENISDFVNIFEFSQGLICKGYEYVPFIKKCFTQDDLVKNLAGLTFRKHLAGEDASINKITEMINHKYLKAKEIIQGAMDIDFSFLYQFSKDQKEIEQVSKLFLSFLKELRKEI